MHIGYKPLNCTLEIHYDTTYYQEDQITNTCHFFVNKSSLSFKFKNKETANDKQFCFLDEIVNKNSFSSPVNIIITTF